MESGGHQAIYNGIGCVHDDIRAFVTYIDYGSPLHDDAAAALRHSLDDRVECHPYYLPLPSAKDKVLDFIYRVKYEIKKLISGKAGLKKDDFSEWMAQLLPKDEGFLRHIEDLIGRFSIDIVQCEMLETAHVALVVPPGVRTIFVEHEIGFVRKQLRLEDKGDRSLSGKVHTAINKDIEVALLNRFDVVVTLSETDKAKLQQAGVVSRIMPSLAIVNTPLSSPSASVDPCVLSFVGPEWHPSNKEGLMWFLDNCWEKLGSHGRYSLQIIGNWSKETSKALSDRYQGLRFLGYVDNLADAVEDTVMIVPINIGSGIRMKILDACAIGIPVVTTTVGAEGLPLVSGENCLIADDPDAFVSAVIAFGDEQLRLSLVRSAQEVISSRYSLPALRDNRLPLYE